MSQKTVTIRKNARGPHGASDCTISVHADYESEFIKRMKYVPTDERQYDPETKVWHFRPEHWERLKGYAVECSFDEIIMVDDLETEYVRRNTSQLGMF